MTGIPFCLKPRELMAAGGWLNGTAAEDAYTRFWNERFLVTVPEELVAIVFPHLAQLEQVSVPCCHIDVALNTKTVQAA